MNDTLIHQIDTEPLSLDPARCADYIGRCVLGALCRPLLRVGEAGEVTPGCTDYQVSADGLTYTLRLDPARWSDGVAVSAADVVFALRRLVHPDVHSVAGSLLEAVRNAEEILTGGLSVEALGVTAIDETTVRIELENPVAYFPAILATTSCAPLPRHRFTDYSQSWDSLVTNGPFVLERVAAGKALELRRNPFWSLEPEPVKHLRFVVRPQQDAAVDEYERGEAHITCNTFFPLLRLPQFSGRPDLHQRPSGILFVVHLNRERHALFADKRLRQALDLAVAREDLAASLHHGILPWRSYIPAGLGGRSIAMPAGENSPQPEQARRLWRLAGAEALLPDRPLRLAYTPFHPNLEVVSALARCWWETLGLSVELQSVPFSTHAAALEDGAYDLALSLLTPLYRDASSLLRAFLPDLHDSARQNLTDLLIAAQEQGRRVSEHLLTRADVLLREEVPAVVVASGLGTWLQQPTVSGYEVCDDGSFAFGRLSLGGTPHAGRRRHRRDKERA